MSHDAFYNPHAVSRLYPDLPYAYRDAALLVVVFRSDPVLLRELVPRPLVSSPQGHMVIMCCQLPVTPFGAFNEIFLLTPVTLGKSTGNYNVSVYLDNDSAIVAGREVFGFPKKLASFRWGESAGTRTVVAERRGVEIVRAGMTRAQVGTAADVALDLNLINVRTLPAMGAGMAPERMQLTNLPMENLRVHDVHLGPATLEFGDSPSDPLGSIPVIEVLGGLDLRVDFDLVRGSVLYEYSVRL